MQSFDVVIVGGGMVGLVCALALKESDLSVAIIESGNVGKHPSGAPELKVSALSVASENIFKNLGVWSALDNKRMASYQDMLVWDQDSFAKITFDHQSVNQAHLGHIVENQALRCTLWAKAEKASNITLLAGKKINKLAFGQQEAFISLDDDTMLSAKLVVGADGANSYVRQQAALPLTFWDYDHTAIVATIVTSLPHEHCARQIFTPTGPLAFLPLWDEHQCSIVWSQEDAQAQKLLGLSTDEFNKALSAAFDGRLGVCKLISERQSYPLKMRYARTWVKDRVALIGDAAHTVHPLAGQGANLGFLDAAALSEQILSLHKRNKDIGLAKNLRPFERWRKTEAAKLIGAMEGFKRLFSGAHPFKKLLRGAGLQAVNHLPHTKNNIIRQAMGTQGELPLLAKAK